LSGELSPRLGRKWVLSRMALAAGARDGEHESERDRLAVNRSSPEKGVRSMNEVLLTPEGLVKVEQELQQLSTVGRAEIAERLRHALESGDDLAENGDYFDVKEDQAMLEKRIALLKRRLTDARLIEPSDCAEGVVAVGARVRLRDLQNGDTVEYRIVGSPEANPDEFRLSNQSPVGKTVLGRRKGETVEVAAPRGVFRFKILDVAG
jgi:transcription elongation factor GreA